MNTGMISKRYAKALLAYAKEKKQEQEIYSAAKMLIENFRLQPQISVVLENPVVAVDKKKMLVLTASQQKPESLFDKFVDLLILNNRLNYIQLTMLSFVDLYREEQNVFAGKVISATVLDKNSVTRLKAQIEQRKKGILELELEVQPDLLGGFILEIDNTRWDASLKRRLQRVKNELITK